MRSYSVVHLIHHFGIGGVERLAQSMAEVQVLTSDRTKNSISFELCTVFEGDARPEMSSLWNPLIYVGAIKKIVNSDPDVLVVSLWRAVVVGIAVKILIPKVKLVVFFHSSRPVHLFDRVFSVVGLKLATEVWGDSQETLIRRAPFFERQRTRPISCLLHVRATRARSKVCSPNFMFWGRIHPHKNIERSLRIFAGIRERYSSAKFWIIGPDDGGLDSVTKHIDSYRLHDSVFLLGEACFEQIRYYAERATFYLQASVVEGFAMSVVEAMQLGLIPVVAPVGQISHYARHGENSIIIDQDDKVVLEIQRLLESPERIIALRDSAMSYWRDHLAYEDAFADSCFRILDPAIFQ